MITVVGASLLVLGLACGTANKTDPPKPRTTDRPPSERPPPVTQRPQVVVPCANVDETYYSTCDALDASPQLPRAPAPYQRCAATLRAGVFMREPPEGTAATFDAEVTRVTCAELACGYSYCDRAPVAPAAEADPAPRCSGQKAPVCIAAPPAGVAEPAPDPYGDCPAALRVDDGIQRLDPGVTAEARGAPSRAHACCYPRCFSYPG
jgi:hypothetical protein